MLCGPWAGSAPEGRGRAGEKAVPHCPRTVRHHRDEVNASRLDDVEKHVASASVTPGVDPPTTGRGENKSGPPFIGVRNVPGRAIMRLGSKGQLSARSIRLFGSDIEGTVATHSPDDFGLGSGFDWHRAEDERPEA